MLEFAEKKPGVALKDTVGFQAVPDPFASFGYAAKDFVLRFPVCAPAAPEKVFVQIQGLYPHAEAIFVPKNCAQNVPCDMKTGMRISHDRNALFVFDGIATLGYIYLDAVPPGSRRYPVFASVSESFFSAEKRYLLAAGLFFGALFTIFVYNLALYFGLKESINLYYSVYLLLFIILFLTLERIPENFAGHSGHGAYLFFRSAVFPAMLIPFALFNREFLASVSGKLQNRAWLVFIFADILLICLNFFIEYRRMMPVNILAAVMHAAFALIFIVRAIMAGFRPAWIMFLGWLFFLVSAILSSLHLLGKFSVGYNDYLTHMMKFGSVAENLLFTVALGVRVRFYKDRAERFASDLAAERETLARDLHDVLGSEFGQIQMKLNRADVPSDIAVWLGQKSRGLSARIRDIIFLLRSDLTQATIREELDSYLDILRGFEKFSLKALVTEGVGELNAFLLLDALRILQEWSGNCMRHGNPSRMEIRIEKRWYGLRLAVISDGLLFRWSGGRYGEGQGLHGIRARTHQRAGFARSRPILENNIFIAVLKAARH